MSGNRVNSEYVIINSPTKFKLQKTRFYMNLIYFTGWRPVVAVFFFVTYFLVTDIIVLSDSIFWLNKQGLNVGIILIYFFEIDYIVCVCDRSLCWVTKEHKIMKAAYQWWPLLLP